MDWQDDPTLAAHYVLFVSQGGPNGRYKRPGGFAELLVRTIFKADRGNRARLALAFPVYVAAVVSYTDTDDGHLKLQALVDADHEMREQK